MKNVTRMFSRSKNVLGRKMTEKEAVEIIGKWYKRHLKKKRYQELSIMGRIALR